MRTPTYNPTQPLPPGPEPLGWHDPHNHPTTLPHVCDWMAHVDAGRIGGNPPCPPAVAARREANERVLRGLRR